MVLGSVIRIEAAAVIGLHDLQPLLVEFVERQVVAIEVVEDAELHGWLSASSPDPMGGGSPPMIGKPHAHGKIGGVVDAGMDD
jgi:hypothetical protein